jgi:hypothetical protein
MYRQLQSWNSVGIDSPQILPGRARPLIDIAQWTDSSSLVMKRRAMLRSIQLDNIAGALATLSNDPVRAPTGP